MEGAGKEKEKRKREEIFLDQVHLGSRLVFITEHPSKISWGCLLFFLFLFFFLGEFRAGQSKPRRRAASKQH